MDASRDAERTPGTGRVGRERLRTIAKILIIDVAAPLATYSVLRSVGLSTVTALVLSGVIPALGMAAGFVRHRHVDVVGALVLAGIVVGSVLGLLTHDPRVVLTEGSVPTVVFGAACLGSLGTRRPLMFGFSLEFIGPDTPTGREMTNLWQYAEFRRIFRTITDRLGRWIPPRSRPARSHRLQHVHRDRHGDLEGHAVSLDSRVDGMDGGIRPRTGRGRANGRTPPARCRRQAAPMPSQLTAAILSRSTAPIPSRSIKKSADHPGNRAVSRHFIVP